ncbi:SET domain-containing protein SmydA-8 [Macrosteles quadrilineatus]|uniref:SET domain-containing protein SmydA-8 n=1 Tax=Macrosteles quadrilineatus TaxID=74068 RepID=UPI0023E1AC50|nr:SET domain-containing protein SmydA-8 [Macrosteles quadrilineatus]
MAKNYTIKQNDKVGRYLAAAKDLKAGEEVLEEVPWAVGPKSGSNPMCLGCYSPVDGSTLCSECGWPICGEECQKNTAHQQAECTVFKAAGVRYKPETEEQLSSLNGSPQFECITPLRVLLQRDRDPERWEAEVKDLEAHTEGRKTDPDWEIEQVNVVEFLRNKCKLADRFTEDEIHWAIGALEVNAFEIRTQYGFFIRGLYPRTGLMSHNCVANTTHTVYAGENFRSRVRVTIDVPEGGELTVSYTSSIQSTILRRENLKYSKRFDCDCKRCADPTELGTHLSTLKCTKCDNGFIMSTNPLDQEAIWKCSHCEFCIRAETLKKIFKMIQSELEQIEAIEEGDIKIQETERLLKKYKSVLHPRNVYMMSLRHTLVQLYGRAPGYTFADLPDILLERKIELCRQVLATADVVKPGLNRFRGLILYELHVPLMLYNRNRYEYGEIKKEEFKKIMDEVVRILEEALRILSLEDPSTPEGMIAVAGAESLAQLKESINRI